APMLIPNADPATLSFELTAGTAASPLTAVSTTTVTVIAPTIVEPTASAGADHTLASGATRTLEGSGLEHNTPRKTLTYAWTQLTGIPIVLTGANTATATFTAPSLTSGAPSETLTLQLTVGHVDDAVSATAMTTVTVTAPPVVPPSVTV